MDYIELYFTLYRLCTVWIVQNLTLHCTGCVRYRLYRTVLYTVQVVYVMDCIELYSTMYRLCTVWIVGMIYVYSLEMIRSTFFKHFHNPGRGNVQVERISSYRKYTSRGNIQVEQISM